MLQIIIWDNDRQRIAEIDTNLQTALNELKLKAVILTNSEPPSLARENLLSRLPVLEIAGRYWSMQPGVAFSKADCSCLLSKFK
jgi:hypothetical protein